MVVDVNGIDERVELWTTGVDVSVCVVEADKVLVEFSSGEVKIMVELETVDDE